jgi:sec-independent protein translocase protein TatB
MFDLTSSKLLLLAVVALLVIGPKDFPILLRTIGKYVAIIRGHAREFRAQFDEAMRDSELAQMKKDMESLGKETEATLTATTQSVEQTFAEARQSVEAGVDATPQPPPKPADGPFSPAPTPDPAAASAAAEPPPPPPSLAHQLSASPEPATVAPATGVPHQPASQAATEVKVGAAPAAERTGA